MAGVPAVSFPHAPPWARAGALLLILFTMAYMATKSGDQLAQPLPVDFEYFYKAGESLYQQGVMDDGRDLLPDGSVVTRGMLDWYLPIVGRLMTPFTLLPLRVAGGIWAVLNLALLFFTLRMLGRSVSGFPPQDWAVTQAVPFLLLIVYWTWEFTMNQIDTLTLFLLVLGFVVWQRGRLKLAGFWIGLAALIKLTPALVIFWFALKRQYRTVGVALLTILLAGPVADVVIFGPQYARDIYSGWVHRAVSEGSHRGLIMSQREMDWRNQGWGAVASRWLHETNWNTFFNNEPRLRNYWPPKYINIASVPTQAVTAIVMSVLGLSFLLLVWIARKPARLLNPWQIKVEWALFMLAMLWFMPVMRRYHMIWALPMLTVLGPMLHALGLRHWWSRLMLGVIVLVAGAQLSLLVQDSGTVDHIVEAFGVHLLVVGLLGACAISLLAAAPNVQKRLAPAGTVQQGHPPAEPERPDNPASRIVLPPLYPSDGWG